MKNYYIRTKTNIFEVVDETDLVYRIIGASRERNNIYSRTKKLDDVIAQADTIEELCDEFIGILDNGNGSHIWYNDDETEWETPEELSALKFKYAKANLSLNEVLLGAIWTDKGLTFVARMNEKGELELL